MNFIYNSFDGKCVYHIIFPSLFYNDCVDILAFNLHEKMANKAWTFSILFRETRLKDIGLFGSLPEEVENYVNRIIDLKAFW